MYTKTICDSFLDYLETVSISFNNSKREAVIESLNQRN
jgi:hypothetical protein